MSKFRYLLILIVMWIGFALFAAILILLAWQALAPQEWRLGWSENGRSGFAVAAYDGTNNSFSKRKAGPAEVLLSAGNVPARGRNV